MKLVKQHRFRNGFQLALLLGTLSAFVVFREKFIESFSYTFEKTETPILSVIFLIYIAMAVSIMLFIFCKELFKSKTKIIDENKQLLTNRIKYHQRMIAEIEKEIEKINGEN